MTGKGICVAIVAGLLAGLLLVRCCGKTAWAGEPLTESQFKSLIGVLVRDQTPRYIGQESGKILVVPLKPEVHRAFVAASIPALLVAVGALYRENLSDINEMEEAGNLWRVEGIGLIEMAVYGISLQKSWVEILDGQNKGRSGWMLNAFLDMDRREFRPVAGMELKGISRFEPKELENKKDSSDAPSKCRGDDWNSDCDKARELMKELERH